VTSGVHGGGPAKPSATIDGIIPSAASNIITKFGESEAIAYPDIVVTRFQNAYIFETVR